MSAVIKTLPLRIRTPFQRRPTTIGWRNFADRPSDPRRKKEGVVQGTSSFVHLRVRRARPGDVPRVIRFVQLNAPLLWPGANVPRTSKSHIAIKDLLCRSLSQGHTMLAEQQDANRGWSQVRGLALNTSLSPWDAILLEKWAQCIQCDTSKKLILLSAQFLQASALHEKYMVSQILQIVLLVPSDTPRASQVAQVLVKASMHRGRDLGYKVLRFDVTSELINKVLSGLKLTKEWEANVNFDSGSIKVMSDRGTYPKSCKKIIVYTAFPQRDAK